MKKTTAAQIGKSKKLSCIFCISAWAAAVLFVRQNLHLFVLPLFLAALVCVCTVKGKMCLRRNADPTEKAEALVLTLLVLHAGIDGFAKTWMPSGKAARLAAALGISTKTLLTSIAVCGAAIAAYAVNRIIQLGFVLLADKLGADKGGRVARKIVFCVFFTASAFVFVGISSDFTSRYKIALGFTVAAAAAISGKMYDTLKNLRQNVEIRIGIILTAAGICRWAGVRLMREIMIRVPEAAQNEGHYTRAAVIAGIFSLFFVYCCLSVFADFMQKLVEESGVFSGIQKAEIILYGILLALGILLIALAFTRSNAFYGSDVQFDIIYTSDSVWHQRTNSYLALANLENDIRQPLFAVFAAPFAGITYLFGSFFGDTVQAICVASGQAALLMLTNFILAKMLRLSPTKRMGFMLLFSSSYMYILSVLMLEQYITAYFWLILSMYLLCEKHRADSFVVCGAGGTLLTSLALAPFSSKEKPHKNFGAWFRDMVRCGCMFLGLMLLFGRTDVLLNSLKSAERLAQFTGNELTLSDKIYQYFGYIRNCFFAPYAGVDETAYTHASWQMKPIASISAIGAVILALVVLCVVLDRKRTSTLAAGGWILFSVLVLVVLGWGTKENGLILYSLYFGWTFPALLFRLAEIVQEKLKLRYFAPALAVGFSVILVVQNVPAVWQIVQFAARYYPV